MRANYVPEWLERKAMELKDLIARKGRVLVAVHRNADPDAVASGIVLRDAIERLGARAYMGFPEGMNQVSKRVLREILGLEPSAIPSAPPENDYDLLVVVDTASEEQLGDYARLLGSCDMVLVDHHDANSLVRKSVLAIYDPQSKSSSELAFMIVRCAWGMELSHEKYTLLLSGIVYDTRHFTMAAARTLRVAADLMDSGANLELVLKALQSPPMDFSERIARLKAALRMHVFRAGTYIIAVTHVGAFESSVARALLDLGADIAVVLCERAKEVRVIGRAKRTVIEELGFNLGRDLMEPLAQMLGGSGGGHAQAAGAAVKSSLEKAMDAVISVLGSKLSEKGLKLEPVV